MGNDQAYAAIPAQPGGGTAAGDYNRLVAVVRSILNKIATMTPVEVVAVNGQTVDIRPLVSQTDGAGNKVDHGVIHNAPVIQLQAGGGAIVMTPVVGDMGIAIFAHSDISKVKNTKAAALPGSRRKFDWADAIYLGGVLNGTPNTTITFAPTGQLIISTNNEMISLNAGSAQIRLTSSSLVSTTGPFAAGNGMTTTAVDKNGKMLTFTNGILTGVA